MRFNVVVANPPLSLDKEGPANDRHNRFWGRTAEEQADYAFITHMIESKRAETGG
jgi:type I restriction-modification system DNA methylase subunit